MASGKLARLRPRQDVDMTQGSIAGHIIRFAIPLLIGNLFQQMYNMVDTWVVGNYVSNAAFSAVGTVGPIINMLIGFFMGLASGTGVVISQHYGAKQFDKVHDAVHTALCMTLILSVLFTFIGIFTIPLMLKLINMPEEVAPAATTYLFVYFTGLGGLLFYNMGAGILRSVGDSRRPFYFLVVCAVLNTILDLLFVLVFHMGVEGVALATVISQCVSAILVLAVMARSDSCIQFRIRDLKIHWVVLRKIFAIGIPAAVQGAITCFSNVFVQAYINYFGADCMSGWTAYSKIDQLLFLPMSSLSLSVTTFVGQNLGNSQVDRAKKGVRVTMAITILVTLVIMMPVLIFAPQMVRFFNGKEEVVYYGTMLIRWLTPFYVLCCFNQIYNGALRGAGNSKIPTLIMLGSFVLFRQVYLFIMSHVWNEIIPIGMGYPAGWLVCSILCAIYYHHTSLDKTRVVDD